MSNSKTHYAWWIMISCCAISFSCLGVFNAMGVFFAPVIKELGFSLAGLSLYSTIFQIVMVIALPFAGKIIPKANLRLLLSIMVVVEMSSFIVMATGHSLISWYIGGALLGIGAGFVCLVPIPLMINSWFKKKTGFALGLSLAFSGVGGAVLNPLCQYIITNYGWRMAYIALGVIATVIVLPFTLFVVSTKPADRGMQAYGAEEAKDAPAVKLTGVSLTRALKAPSYYLVLISAALFAFGTNLNMHIPKFLTSIGYNPMVGATVASTVMIGVIIGKVALGALNDKFGMKVASGIALLAGTLGMVLFLMGKGNVAFVYLGAVGYGFGYAMYTVEPPLIVKTLFGLREFSSLYSYVSMVGSLVGAFAVFLYGFLFDLTKSYSTDLIIVGAMYVISLMIVILAVNSGKNLKNEFTE